MRTSRSRPSRQVTTRSSGARPGLAARNAASTAAARRPPRGELGQGDEREGEARERRSSRARWQAGAAPVLPPLVPGEVARSHDVGHRAGLAPRRVAAGRCRRTRASRPRTAARARAARSRGRGSGAHCSRPRGRLRRAPARASRRARAGSSRSPAPAGGAADGRSQRAPRAPKTPLSSRASALYTRANSPRKPILRAPAHPSFRLGERLFDERDPAHGASPDAEGDRRLAGREHHADLSADRRVLRAARARGERHRRRRGGAGHQGLRPDRQPPADRRGDQALRARPQGEPAADEEPRRRGRGEAQGAALHAAQQAPGPARRHRLAGEVPPRALGRADRQARRHHQADDPVDPRPQPLEHRQHRAGRPGGARPLQAGRARRGGGEGGQEAPPPTAA